MTRAVQKPIAWSIGGFDSSAGAGLSADLATFSHFGVYGCGVITTVTAQNSCTMIERQDSSKNVIASQIQVLDQDLSPNALKIGALGSTAAVRCVAHYLATYELESICDPVFMTSTGGILLESEAIDLLRELILPRITLLTPNIAEAEVLLKMRIHTHVDMEIAAQKFLAMGVRRVLIKGGHLIESTANDYFLDQQQGFWLQNLRSDKKAVHGTGCVLSAAIAAAIAQNYDFYDALVIAKMYVSQAIRSSLSIGKGSLLMNHQQCIYKSTDLPWIRTKMQANSYVFPDCGPDPIGFYPIVDSVAWVKRLIVQGVRTIQLRIKDQIGDQLEQSIKTSIALSKQYQVRLFINDYWNLAIKYQAYGVHLGQEDLQSVDITALRQSGLRLGISSHCFYEVARAHAYRPSYIAFGPIYTTTSKVMSFAPQGVSQLAYWHSILDYPLVAIGGITLERLPEVLATGVEGIAVISAVTQASNPDDRISLFLNQIETTYDRCQRA